MQIASFSDLLAEARDIQGFLEVTMSEDVTEALERGNALSAYVARTGKMLADARHHLDTVLNSEVMAILRDVSTKATTSKAVNALIDSAAKDQRYLFMFCERLNRTATHQLDWCRTVVSKAKADIYATPGVRG